MSDIVFRVIDVETTGFAPPAEVIEIGWHDVLSRFNAEPGSGPVPDIIASGAVLAKPTAPIPPETSAIHHLIERDFLNAGSYAEALAKATAKTFNWIGARLILVAHNAAMERQWLEQPFSMAHPEAAWICTWKCASRLWPEAPGHSNQCLRYWLDLPGIDRAYANQVHRAGPDAYVTAFILHRLLKCASLDDLLRWSSEPALLARVPFGRSKGARWSEVDTGFLLWVLDEARNFDADVKHTARVELEHREVVDAITSAIQDNNPQSHGDCEVAS